MQKVSYWGGRCVRAVAVVYVVLLVLAVVYETATDQDVAASVPALSNYQKQQMAQPAKTK